MKRPPEKDEFLRKRAERQRKIRKRRLTVMFCLLIFLLLCVGTVLSLTVFFPIAQINISGSAVYSTEELKKASGVKIGDNLFTASGAEIEKNLKNKLPYVEGIELKRKLPDTLSIKVTDADEYACYNAEGRYYLISKSGWVLQEKEAPPENLLTVTGVKIKCKVGSAAVFSEEKDSELISLMTEICEKQGIALNTADLSSSVEISLKVENRFEVNLGTANNVEEKLNHLGGMLKSIEKDKTGRINLSMWTEDNTQGTFTPAILE